MNNHNIFHTETRLSGWIYFVSCLMFAGCSSATSSGTTVSGVVNLDGAPFPVGVVIFEHQGSGAGMSAEIHDGKFTFAALVPPGSYKVAIQQFQGSSPLADSASQKPVDVPQRYRETFSSQLKAEIDQKPGNLVFDMTTKQPRP